MKSLRTLIGVIPFLFHEFCHWVVMLLFCPFVKIRWAESYFYITLKDGLVAGSCNVLFDCKYKILSLLILSAPLWVWFVLFTVLMMTQCFFWAGFVFAMCLFEESNMSSTDIKHFLIIWKSMF